jgi:hypothetical protein
MKGVSSAIEVRDSQRCRDVLKALLCPESVEFCV